MGRLDKHLRDNVLISSRLKSWGLHRERALAFAWEWARGRKLPMEALTRIFLPYAVAMTPPSSLKIIIMIIIIIIIIIKIVIRDICKILDELFSVTHHLCEWLEAVAIVPGAAATNGIAANICQSVSTHTTLEPESAVTVNVDKPSLQMLHKIVFDLDNSFGATNIPWIGNAGPVFNSDNQFESYHCSPLFVFTFVLLRSPLKYI